MESKENLRNLILLSVQRALLDKIGGNLIGVAASWNTELVRLVFWCEKDPSEQDWEDFNDIEAEVVADMPEDLLIESEVILSLDRIDTSNLVWVYKRKGE